MTERAYLGPEMANLMPGIAISRLKRVSLTPGRAYLSSWMANLKPGMVNLRPNRVSQKFGIYILSQKPYF